MFDTEGDPPPAQPFKRKRTKAGTPSRTKGKMPKMATESFSREELNLRLDLHPLSHYVSDRDNLVDQLFTILSGDELQKMIPATLQQSYSWAEIKERVTAEAKKYQDDDIFKLIRDAVSNVPKLHEEDSNIVQARLKIPTETLSKSLHDTLELCPDQGEIDSLIDTETKEATKSFASNDNEETTETKSEDNETQRPSESNDGTTDLSGVRTEWVSSLARSQLEILELEMRARAIRSLMKAQGMPVPDDESEEDTEIGEQELLEEEESEAESGKPLVELPESEMLPRGNVGVDDRVEETEVESDSATSECETCASERDVAVVPGQEESVIDLPTGETFMVEAAFTIEDDLVTLEEIERGEEPEVGPEDSVIAEVVPEKIVEEVPNKTMKEEIEEVLSTMLWKVVSDEVEASKKRKRRNRRHAVEESDMEDKRILEDNDT